MKKVFMLMVVMLLGISTVAFSQMKYGVKAALNMSNVKFSEDIGMDPKVKMGLAIGGFLRFDVSEKFAIQPELLYSSMGTVFKDIEEEGFEYDATYKLGYLSVPIIAKYYVSPGLSIQAGPQLDLLLSAKVKYEAEGESETEDMKDEFESLNLGLAFGLGYEMESGLGFDLRYVLGLSELMKDADEVKTKSTLIQIGVTYKF